MSDEELQKHSSKTYNFKFMDTEADKQFIKQMMVQKLAMARNKSKLANQHRGETLKRKNLMRRQTKTSELITSGLDTVS